MMNNHNTGLDIKDYSRIFKLSTYMPHTTTSEHDIFPIKYAMDEYGFRTSKLQHEKVLALGCSFTSGQGLPVEHRWSNILSDKLGTPVINLGQGGDSIINQVRSAFWYFKNFGNPEVVLGLFPLTRMPFVKVSGKNESSLKRYKENETPEYAMQLHDFFMDDIHQYAKAPYNLTDVLAQEQAVYYNNMFIDMLERYCVANNIILFWNTWEPALKPSPLLDYAEKYYQTNSNHYITIESNWWTVADDLSHETLNGYPVVCHSEYSDDPLFHLAADRIGQPITYKAHWGLHRQIHVAEAFHKALGTKSYKS